NKANRKEVIAQVDALYDTLRVDYTMHYLQASVPYSGPGSSTAATQNIKLPAEVLQQRSGMCIELTLLLASAVERIGLHPEVVIIPGHAFLGVAVTPDNKHFEYWDAVQVNANVAGDSANIATDAVYQQNQQQHTIVDTILISDARNANINPML
ncbi:MAG TPA: transglutaminase family protein, partial [Ktedonobacteraceae bacterium]|nr:transglutaminase family protein [Ktedonobacteraceae bacterium]